MSHFTMRIKSEFYFLLNIISVRIRKRRLQSRFDDVITKSLLK